MEDGILLVDKQKDITSYDVIRICKRVFPKGQKIGHAGTLDPFATGLLIILLGKCTKLMDTIHSYKKEYIVKAEFGYSTDTQDVTGNKLQSLENINYYKEKLTESVIKEEIDKNFIGKLQQVPPIYSAKKINGQKAYDLARKGQNVELKPKEIDVYSFDVVSLDFPYATFRIECSTGTYIRTLVNDLGFNLGVYATAVELRRTKIGEYNVEDAISSADINENNIYNYIIKQ